MTTFSMKLNCDDIKQQNLYPILFLNEIPSDDHFKSGNLSRIVKSDKSIFIWCQSLCVDIPVGTEFDIIFPHHDIEMNDNINAVLKYVSINPAYEVSYLPNGYSGICLIDFPDGLPAFVAKIKTRKRKV
ncbi:MAG TPA: hypothetical protein VIM65_12775 [Cyclobacteriaceae bacterium]